MPIKAVAFDAFGTILKIEAGVNPYRQLLREGRIQGRRPKPDDAHQIMTLNLDLAEAAEHFGIKMEAADLQRLTASLDAEVAGIQPYEDAIEAIALLRQHGVRIGVCSNLAKPYRAAIMRLFPGLDGYAFSYEEGVSKPHPAIYRSICQKLGVVPGDYFGTNAIQVAMIGDSIKCDRDGPRGVGMMGFHLDRSGKGNFADLVRFARLVIEEL
ncbi:haloacid dehalogenase [Pseudomonas floridensis]|uniref:Haloacid dehalogenase n=1 Tax=Pseudomonas floridensis TaxID=1958950 RepID=A0A1X0N3C2_9PSED|nr:MULTISPECIES: HAD family hydrolase [Pseudomonas]AZG86593.1 HAD family hydrolase [Pseudomonas syringae pv. pisi str. PP1]ORC57886.1 haloacid dehalogenase [Pseudomonas floridensis]UZS65026.1 HAD family hydrolase [Pseudomonas syringae]